MILPQWTKKYNTSQGGRDFLGYMNVGVIMLERLLPGISNITDRLRYYSFFSWVLYRFFRTDNPKTPISFKKYLKIKSLAFLYANGLMHKDSSNVGLNGIELVRVDLRDNGEREIYQWDEEYVKNYKDNYWVYSQKIKQVGATADNENYELESLTNEWGKKIAMAYDAAIKNTEYYKKYCDKSDQKIPANVLVEYSRSCNAVGLDQSPEEQQLLFDLMFRFDKIATEQKDFSPYYSANPPNIARSRRESMLLILDIIDQVGGSGLGYDDFQKIILYSKVQNIGYKVTDKLSHCLEYWRIFQARQFLIYAIESFFTVLTSQIYNRNIEIEVLLKEMKEMTVHGITSFEEKHGISFNLDTKITDMLLLFSKGKTDEEIDHDYNLSSKINEWNLYKTIESELKKKEYSSCLSGSFMLLVLLYVRFNYYRKNNLPYWDFSYIGGDINLSIDSFFSKLDDMDYRGLLVEDMIDWIIKELVIKQHSRVAIAKLSWYKNNTFHFEYSGGMIKGLKKARPNMNAPKFNNVINFIEDLGLAVRQDDKIIITDKGKKTLNEYTKINN